MSGSYLCIVFALLDSFRKLKQNLLDEYLLLSACDCFIRMFFLVLDVALIEKGVTSLGQHPDATAKLSGESLENEQSNFRVSGNYFSKDYLCEGSQILFYGHSGMTLDRMGSSGGQN